MKPRADSSERSSAPLHRHVVSASDREQQTIEQIHEALAGLTFGSLNLVVQDGVVVHIVRTEKLRPMRSADDKASPSYQRHT